MAEVTELDSAPNRNTLSILDRILSVAESMTAFAMSPHQLSLMEAKVSEMKADRDAYEARLLRVEGTHE